MMKWPKLKFAEYVTLIRGVLWGLPDAYTYTSREATGLAEFTISLDGEEVYKVTVKDNGVTCGVTFAGVALKRLTAHKKLADLTAEERALLDRAFEVPRRIRRELETVRRVQDMSAAKTGDAPAPSMEREEGTEGDPLPSPRSETLRKVAMVRKVIRAWRVSKTRACKCVGIRVDTYAQYNDRPEFEARIQKEIGLLEKYNFGGFLSAITPSDRGTATGLYDDFWATA